MELQDFYLELSLLVVFGGYLIYSWIRYKIEDNKLKKEDNG